MAAQKAEPDENPKSIEKAIREGDCREAVLLATAKAARLLDSTESARDARPLYSCIMEGVDRLAAIDTESRPKHESESARVLRMVMNDYEQRQRKASELRSEG